MKKKRLFFQILFLLFLIIGTFLILRSQPKFRTDNGMVFGTIYQITYQSHEELRADIENELKKVDFSLSI